MGGCHQYCNRINISQTLFLGYNSNGNNGRSTIIRLENKSSLFINGSARIFYGGDIMLFENAKLSIGNSYINSGCTIRVTDRIEIGDDCAISFGFTAMDNNFHQINGVNIAKPVIVEDHVWIGAGVTILPGVVVGTGSIIAAGAIVTKSIPPHSLVAGIPARIIKKDIEWKM